MISVRISADRWLWRAELADRATGHVANGYPQRADRFEGIGLAMVAVHEVDAPPGTLLVCTPAGTSSRSAGYWGGSHAVHRLGADGSLTNVPMDAAADELDPAGAEARLHRRLAIAAGLSLETVLMRMREGHGYEGGTVVEWAGYWAIIERATAKQVWARAPSYAEMTEAGLPITRSDTQEARAAAARIWGPSKKIAHERPGGMRTCAENCCRDHVRTGRTTTMRKFAKMLAAVIAAMAAATKVVWEAGKAVVKSVIPSMPMPVADEVEEAMERVAATPPADGGAPLPLVTVDVGQKVFDHALSKLSHGRHPAPSMAEIPDDIVKWVGRLSDGDLRRLTQHGPKRTGEHALGVRAIPELPLCREPRIEPGFAKIGGEIRYIGKVVKADVGPAPVREETHRETALAILQDLIDDQPEPVGLKAA